MYTGNIAKSRARVCLFYYFYAWMCLSSFLRTFCMYKPCREPCFAIMHTLSLKNWSSFVFGRAKKLLAYRILLQVDNPNAIIWSYIFHYFLCCINFSEALHMLCWTNPVKFYKRNFFTPNWVIKYGIFFCDTHHAFTKFSIESFFRI